VATPALAATRFEVLSTTRFQLRHDLDGARRAPLYEDLFASMRVGLKNRRDFNAVAMMKVGTTLGMTGGDLDLYLLNGTMHWRRLRLGLTFGRQMLSTPAGLRIVDGVSGNGRPHTKVRLNAAIGWLRDTEWDDLSGGALLVQGGGSVHFIPGANAGLDVAFRAGPTTSPRVDGRLHADALLKLPLTPRPWLMASMRFDTGQVRRVRGGVSFHPIGPLRFEVLGRLDNAADHDGTMAERILADMTSSVVGGGGVGARIRAPGGVLLSGNYLLTGYRVSEAKQTAGHSVDASARWGKEVFTLSVDYMLRSSYGGTFHAIGATLNYVPHRVVGLRFATQVVPYQKLSKPWKVAGWALGEAAIRPARQIEVALGGEYRTSALFQHDIRLNARLVVHLLFWQKPV
jgi:hypothetical protein